MTIRLYTFLINLPDLPSIRHYHLLPSPILYYYSRHYPNTSLQEASPKPSEVTYSGQTAVVTLFSCHQPRHVELPRTFLLRDGQAVICWRVYN